MASTLNFVINQIQADLQVATARSVHSTVNDILRGRSIDPNVIVNVTDKVINNAMGNIFNNATHMVNSTIANALGKKFKNSALNVIAGNYASSVLTQVITGRQTQGMTIQMTNSISQGISRELFNRLPASITKNIKIDVLGTTFNTGLSSIVNTAINNTVKAVVTDVFSQANSIAKVPSIDGITTIPSISTSNFIPDFSNISNNLISGLSNAMDQLGSSIDNVIKSIESLGDSKLPELTLPAGLDMSRFSSSSTGMGKMIELSSHPIGTADGVSGLGKSDFEDVQKQLADSNINNPLLSLGGDFDGISNTISGTETLSGMRSITKDLTCKLSDINSSFGIVSNAEKQMLETVEKNTVDISKNAAKQATTDAANFKSLTTDQLEKLTNIKEGFKDPNAKFPLPEYQHRTETNKLATGDVENTIVDKKNSERMLGAQLPNGGSWDQPVSPYNAKYPYNLVRETESGHVIELDDTPNSERIHMYHKAGTFVEVDPLGNMVRVIKGSDYTIVDSNGYISIQGKANVSINGSCNVFIGADANIEVNGNTHVNCHNNIELNAAGRLKLTAGEGIDIKSPEVYIDADNQLQLNADVNAKLHVKEFNMIVDTDMKVEVHNDHRLTVSNNSDMKVSGDTKIHSVGGIHVKSDTTIHHTASEYDLHVTGDIKESSDGSIYFKSGGTYNMKASGIVAADGSEVHLNSGKATVSEPTDAALAVVADALETEYSDTSYLVGRKGVVENVISDSFVKDRTVTKVSSNLMASIMSEDSTVNDATKATLIEDHNVDPNEIEKPAIILETAEVATVLVTPIIPQELPLGDTVFPANFKLSPYFTIESLTTNATEPNVLQPVGDTMPLSKIVTNLQYIALNVLEPIYAVRPDMIVHNGFTPIKDGQTTLNRYNYGLAVALDFKNATSFDDYYNIANIIRQIVTFDELTVVYMSAAFTGSHTDSGVIIIKVPGVYYPNITSESDAKILEQWVSANNKNILRTWYNGKIVDDKNLVRVA